MRRTTVVLAVVALVAGVGLAGCDWPAGTRYVHRVFDGVEVIADVPYRTAVRYDGTPVDLLLNLYLPAGDTATERPVMLWQFGGGWTWGDRNQLDVYGHDSARRGYVGVTIDYRTRDEEDDDVIAPDPLGAFFDAYDDGVAAVAWLRDHAADYGIDPDVIVTGGVSAGAVNSLGLGYLPPLRGPSASPVQGVVSISGAFGPPLAQYSGTRPPTIVHQGAVDDVVPPAAAQTTCATIAERANTCEYVEYPEGDHYIVITDKDEVQDRSATFVFESVLLRHGYTHELVAP